MNLLGAVELLQGSGHPVPDRWDDPRTMSASLFGLGVLMGGVCVVWRDAQPFSTNRRNAEPKLLGDFLMGVFDVGLFKRLKLIA